MTLALIHVALAALQLGLTIAAWRIINEIRRPKVEKIIAEAVDSFPELYPQYHAEVQRRKAPTYRQTQASAAAFVIEAA